MKAKTMLDAGNLDEAIAVLSSELRDYPGDVQRRAFLFEMLSFAGNWDRAEKQLAALAASDADSRAVALLYGTAISAERERQALFEQGACPDNAAVAPSSGECNELAFRDISDADVRLGARLEIIMAGSYFWLPLAHVRELTIEPPRRLRDLLWIPAAIRMMPSIREGQTVEVLLPALYPFSWKHPDANVRLGRSTVWCADGEAEVPFGQKLFVVDEEVIPFLEIRRLRFDSQ
jgi:type VI secretion system protein ImpE